jgi:hypothetical protein
VIGYVADGPDKGKLTLRGSSTYSTNSGIVASANAMFPGEGLYDYPVYVAYFKYGSLVAVGSHNHDGGIFTNEDIIAAPSIADGYIGLEALKTMIGKGATQATWNMINDMDDSGITIVQGDNIYEKLSTNYIDKGLGDPCDYYIGDGWHVPTNSEATNLIIGATILRETYTPGTPAFDGHVYYQFTGTAAGVGLNVIDSMNPAIATLPMSPDGPTTSLVGAGYRIGNGANDSAFGMLGTNRYGASGWYWTATRGRGTTYKHTMQFNTRLGNPNELLVDDFTGLVNPPAGNGLAIRCVR